MVQKESRVRVRAAAPTVLARMVEAPEKEIPKVMGPDSAAL